MYGRVSPRTDGVVGEFGEWGLGGPRSLGGRPSWEV